MGHKLANGERPRAKVRQLRIDEPPPEVALGHSPSTLPPLRLSREEADSLSVYRQRGSQPDVRSTGATRSWRGGRSRLGRLAPQRRSASGRRRRPRGDRVRYRGGALEVRCRVSRSEIRRRDHRLRRRGARLSDLARSKTDPPLVDRGSILRARSGETHRALPPDARRLERAHCRALYRAPHRRESRRRHPIEAAITARPQRKDAGEKTICTR